MIINGSYVAFTDNIQSLFGTSTNLTIVTYTKDKCGNVLRVCPITKNYGASFIFEFTPDTQPTEDTFIALFASLYDGIVAVLVDRLSER